jgi:hypothetical protein
VDDVPETEEVLNFVIRGLPSDILDFDGDGHDVDFRVDV